MRKLDFISMCINGFTHGVSLSGRRGLATYTGLPREERGQTGLQPTCLRQLSGQEDRLQASAGRARNSQGPQSPILLGAIRAAWTITGPGPRSRQKAFLFLEYQGVERRVSGRGELDGSEGVSLIAQRTLRPQHRCGILCFRQGGSLCPRHSDLITCTSASNSHSNQ